MALSSNDLRRLHQRLVRVRRQVEEYQPYEVLVHLTPDVVEDLGVCLGLISAEIDYLEGNV